MEQHDVDLHRTGQELADALEAALPGWVERSVERIATAYAGTVAPEVRARAAEAGRRAAADVAPAVRRLVAEDVDRQRTNPLSVLRGAVRYPTAVLREAGVPAVVRDEFDERHFPDDDYGLVPLSFGDVDPDLQDLGIAWGAAKARAHLRRRRAVGEGGA